MKTAKAKMVELLKKDIDPEDVWFDRMALIQSLSAIADTFFCLATQILVSMSHAAHDEHLKLTCRKSISHYFY